MQDQRLEWLKTKMDDLFARKAKFDSEGKDFNKGIQMGREYRNPRICEKLIEVFDIKQYGTNLPNDVFDPDVWQQKPKAYYNSSMYREWVDRREKERERSHHHHSHHHRSHHHSHKSSH
uniref:SAP30-binding protein n=1 Tax=Aceria tosichella TaxID=561515 RepID=A0A6G1S867_9ACAR